MKTSNKPTLFISLSLLILLLLAAAHPAVAGRIDINSNFSVTPPNPQSGNPGDFLTYVFEFANSDSNPVDVSIDFDPNPSWGILGDTRITIPAHRLRFIYPLTVQIPADAPANLEKILPIRFRTDTPGLSIPPQSLIARVNPVANIDFKVPSSQNGLNNSTVNYKIVIVNNGNKSESLTVTAVSENKWPLLLNFSTAEVQPGATTTLTVSHKIPSYTPVDADRIFITIKWGEGQKNIELTTAVIDETSGMAATHYLWTGQMSLYHYDLTDVPNYPTGLSWTVHGQWAPSSYAQISLSDAFDPANRRWFVEIQPQPWTVRTGEFNLAPPGLAIPDAAIGRFSLSRKTDQNQYSLDIWQNTKFQGILPTALDLSFEKHSNWSFLSDASPDNPKNVLQHDYWNYINPNLRWMNSLAINFNRTPAPGYAAFLSFSNINGNWLWSFESKHMENLNTYLSFQNFVFSLSQPYSANRFYSSWQLRSEQSIQTENTSLFSLDVYLHWTEKQQIHGFYEAKSTDTRAYDDSVQLAYQYKFNTATLDNLLTAEFSHENVADTNEKRLRFSWETVYHADPALDLLLTPQLTLYHESSQQSLDQFSRMLGGFRWRTQPNQTLASQFYYYFNAPNQLKIEINYDWKISNDYQLILAYLRQWQPDSSPSDTLNLNIRHVFTTSVPKPLATVKGTFFLDKNRNGIMDNDELPVGDVEYLLNGKNPYQSDAKGLYQIDSLTPGEYSINLNPRYEVLYTLENDAVRFHLKPYQTQVLNIPVIRTANLVGLVFLDQDRDRQRSQGEKGLEGIGVILKDENGTILKQTATYDDGTFIFYQLPPGDYRVSVDQSQLPDNVQTPDGYTPIKIDPAYLASDTTMEIGLIPFEKPVEVITPDNNDFTISFDKEVVSPGDILKLSIDAGRELSNLTLTLPGNKTVGLKTAPQQRHWEYAWRLPTHLPYGPTKITCRATDKSGRTITAEADFIILDPNGLQ